MGRAGKWTAQQNEHVAEATLAASDDPISGTIEARRLSTEDVEGVRWPGPAANRLRFFDRSGRVFESPSPATHTVPTSTDAMDVAITN
jgi:hypothetical protein